MIIENTKIPGCMLIHPNIFKDLRGRFIKSFNKNLFQQNHLCSEFEETFYSYSAKNVLRGMHFQVPPFEQYKIVYSLLGSIYDVVIDLRKNSPTYLEYEVFELSDIDNSVLYIPPGLAHGFLVISESSLVMYHVSKVYSAVHDTGILWNSANIPWPNSNPIISNRDAGLPKIQDFDSPF